MANERLIFPELGLFKKTLVESFLVVTREIYKNHPVYKYDDNEESTEIHIYPSYGNIFEPGRQPRFVVKAGGYQQGFNDMLNNNMSGFVTNETGGIIGTKYFKMISPTITVLVHAYTEEESSDLADELTNICMFACKKWYSGNGIIMNMAQVSETDMFDKQNEIYQTTIQFVVDVPWENKTSDTTEDEVIINPEIDNGGDEDITDYRPPGVGVVAQDLDARNGYWGLNDEMIKPNNPEGEVINRTEEAPGIRVFQQWVEENTDK